jgi:hypothetical protein
MALKPIFSRFDHELDHWQWGLGPEDFKKVIEGYACGRCLEEFTVWVPVCPVCKEPNQAPRVAPAPREWLQRTE